MKNFALIFIPFSGWIGLSDDVLTLEEAVSLARKNSYLVKTAEEEINLVKGQLDESRSNVYPKLNFDATYTRFTKDFKVSFDENSPPVVFRPIDRAALQLNLMQIIDLSGSLNLGISAADSLLKVSESYLEAAKNNAELSVKQAYFQVIKAIELVEVAKEVENNAKQRLALAEKRVDAGVAPRFEIIRAQAAVSAAEQDVIRAENAVQIAKSTLNNVLARDISIDFETETISEPQIIEMDLEELTEEALENRPEIHALDHRLNFQISARKARSRGNYPSLTLNARFERDPKAQGFASEKDTLSATAMLSVPIFDAGQTKARTKQATAEENKARIALQETELAIRLEVRQAYLDLQTAQKVIESAKKSVSEATEALRLANVRYEAGVGTQIDVSDAEVLYKNAKNNYVSAVADYRIAFARLQRAVGKEILY